MYGVKQILSACNRLAPPHLAEDYDNVGLLIGDLNGQVTKVLCALDLTEEVVAEAIRSGAQCIITHHPFIFRPIKKIDVSTVEGRILKAVLTHEINVIAIHTNLDIVKGGINDFIAEKLGLQAIKPLHTSQVKPMYKVAFYVPKTHMHQVRNELIAWNPTTLGKYSGTTFSGEGVGTFIPLEGSQPERGVHNQLQFVEEVKIECVVEQSGLDELVACVREVHPYEEMAYDVYKLENLSETEAIGRWGFVEPTSLSLFIEQVKKVFKVPFVRVTSNGDKTIEKVAICSGSGESFVGVASAIADVYITGDMTYHMAQSALNKGLVVIDAGHYATENIAIPLIKDYLEKTCEGLEVLLSQANGEVFTIY